MAFINITLEEDIDITADEWWENADEYDRKSMRELIGDAGFRESVSLMEAQFQAKLKDLREKYHTLPQSTIDLIMSL